MSDSEHPKSGETTKGEEPSGGPKGAKCRKKLSSEAYMVTQLAGTEPPFSGKYNHHKETGIYVCTCCGSPLFSSKAKFDSGSGWPSYYEPVHKDAITRHKDTSHGRIRTEVRCAKCRSHLGHVFDDGPKPTGKRFCINSVALDFERTLENQ